VAIVMVWRASSEAEGRQTKVPAGKARVSGNRVRSRVEAQEGKTVDGQSGRWARIQRIRRLPAALPGRGRLALTTALAVVIASGGLVGLRSAEAAADPCDPPVHVIACENSKPGQPESVWNNLSDGGDPSIQGFTTDISVNRGQTVSFKIKATGTSYSIEIYRLGYYQGNGARRWATISPSVSLPQSQPACVTDPATEIFDCGNWAVSASWAVPSTAVSGVYIARLVKPDGGQSHVPFIVRDDSSTSDLFFQTSDSTWQAYNTYGGSDFYRGGANGRAYKLSYNRPWATRENNSRDWLFSNEYPMIRFLEHNGYDLSYTTNVDSDRRGNLIQNHKVFLSVGHDEYWSGQQRANVAAARDAGTSLAFFSGNEVYWKTRWENSQAGTSTPYRTLVCYKETWAAAKIDPSTEWTGTYRDPRFSPPSNGGVPENSLTGTMYIANHDDLPVQVPAEQGKLRIWRGTGLSALLPGQTATLAPHTVGYESNEDLDNGFRPQGLIRLSTTVGPTPELSRDFGMTVVPGTTEHHLTLYRASSGALVFSAGSIQFAWGLDDFHDGNTEPPDSRMQQLVINLFADMGAQPRTLMSGLSAASASTDTQAPTATIISPTNGSSVANGSLVNLTGAAADAGGGRVAGVEVSTDGGSSWHPASGTTTWSYSFYAAGQGTQVVRVRAVDDSANIGTVQATVQLNLTGNNNIFGNRIPGTVESTDTQRVELGVKFKAQANGFVKGVRFYKGAGNTGTHTGSIWSSTGTRLKTGTFTGETTSGWQTLLFSTPLEVTANTTYVASYFAPNGRYSFDQYAFSYFDQVAPPLAALRSTVTSGNGVYKYEGGFPTESFKATNYYVDVVFSTSDDTPPAVVATNPLDDTNGAPVFTRPSATFSKSMNASTVSLTLKDGLNANVAGSAAYDSATKTVTFSPTSTLAAAQNYTATVQGRDTSGNQLPVTTFSFTTDVDGSVSKLFPTNAVPTNVADPNDDLPVELGVRFVPDVNGFITGVRFYQGPGNTGTHTGSIWASDGTRLATATFPANTSTGWQTVLFSSPVAVTAGTTYTASYFAPRGHNAYDHSFFSETWTNGPLTAPSGNNGVFKQAATSQFPNQTFRDTNYWVDPLFYPGSTPPPPPPPPVYPDPSSIFTASEAPTATDQEGQSLELGVRLNSTVDGTISAIRFYKSSLASGTHVGSLWSASGQRLATGTFQNETASGWQTLTFATPVPITAGTTYVASCWHSVGTYAVTPNAFSEGLSRPPLHVETTGGAWVAGASAFPNNSANHNYWVDVVFHPE
jgi:hypothetical protein